MNSVKYRNVFDHHHQSTSHMGLMWKNLLSIFTSVLMDFAPEFALCSQLCISCLTPLARTCISDILMYVHIALLTVVFMVLVLVPVASAYLGQMLFPPPPPPRYMAPPLPALWRPPPPPPPPHTHTLADKHTLTILVD